MDGLNGLIFRVSPDGKSYYAFVVILRGHALYETYFPPEVEEEKLSATYDGATRVEYEKSSRGYLFGLGHSMAVLAKIEKGEVTVLRGMRIVGTSPSYRVKEGTWCQMQVKAQGELIQAAVKTSDPRFPTPIYLGLRDATLTSGRVGVFADRSTGRFRNLEMWKSAQMIRDLWR